MSSGLTGFVSGKHFVRSPGQVDRYGSRQEEEDDVERSPSADALFRSVYGSHVDAIRLYCIRRMPLSEVDDATSEVFLVLWRKIDTAPQGDGALLWLYGVARKVVSNRRRSTARFANLKAKASVVAGGPIDGPETVIVENEAAREAIEALNRLSAKEAEIVRLRVWEELTSQEIAEIVGSSPGAVDMRLSRARKKLNRYLTVDTSRSDRDRPHRMKGGEQE